MALVSTGLTTSSPLVLNQVLSLGKSGAVVVAATGASSIAVPLISKLRGGAVAGAGGNKSLVDVKEKGVQVSPTGKSVFFMATGMALHYLGYSFARSITVALFTSSRTGYPNSPGAFPFAMAFVSPMSLFLLLLYGRILERNGPRGALKRTTLGCACTLLAAAAGIEFSERTDATFWGIPAMKFLTGPLFIFRESYVQLLTSQYWSFMASVLTPDQSAKWFGPVAGLTSIASAVGGVAVSTLSSRVALSGTLALSGIALVTSLIATETAYGIAEEHGFNPTSFSKKKGIAGKHPKKDDEVGMFQKAKALFERVPVLRALFLEILASQGLATLLNVCFVQSLGASIPDDTVRAGWIGNFYALINVITMCLQFGMLPLLMQVIEPKALWRFVPFCSLIFTTFQAFQSNPTLYMISSSLMVMKVLEYSARRMLDEMVYVPLDFESRFVGKEIIGVFGYRFGKSMMSLVLSGLTSTFGKFNLQQLSILCDVACVAWVKTAWDLSSLVPTRREAQESYDRSKKGKTTTSK